MPPDLSHDCVSCISELRPHPHPSQPPGAHWDLLLRCPAVSCCRTFSTSGEEGVVSPIALFGTSLHRTPSSPVSGKSALLRAFPAPGHDIHASWVSVPTALTPQAFPGPAWLSPTPAWLPSHALSTEHSSPIHQVWYARFAGCLTRGGLVSRVRSEAPWR